MQISNKIVQILLIQNYVSSKLCQFFSEGKWSCEIVRASKHKDSNVFISLVWSKVVLFHSLGLKESRSVTLIINVINCNPGTELKGNPTTTTTRRLFPGFCGVNMISVKWKTEFP